MLAIGERFLQQAQEFDERASAAVDANANAVDITKLLDLGAVYRLRVLSAYGACAPYCRPKLAAVEVAPASQSTIDRFERRISTMDEQQVIEHLKQIAAGASALAVVESADDA